MAPATDETDLLYLMTAARSGVKPEKKGGARFFGGPVGDGILETLKKSTFNVSERKSTTRCPCFVFFGQVDERLVCRFSGNHVAFR
jgi:hypothetical protein